VYRTASFSTCTDSAHVVGARSTFMWYDSRGVGGGAAAPRPAAPPPPPPPPPASPPPSPPMALRCFSIT